MKRKRLDRNTGWEFQHFPYYQLRVDCELYHLKKIDEGIEPMNPKYQLERGTLK